MQTDLRRRLTQKPIVVAPGCYDALSALMIERAGFSAAYLSGASVAYTRLGRPDVGLVSLGEVADIIGAIRDRVSLPLVVDADTGFGNAMNVQRTVRLFARQGADALQLEDQVTPKRCGHLRDKRLVPVSEMVGKLHAAADARPHENVLLIARTDAIAVEGFEAALERAESYLEAGADVLFIEAPTSKEQMETVCKRFAGRVPLLANMVEGGSTPLHGTAESGGARVLGGDLPWRHGPGGRAYDAGILREPGGAWKHGTVSGSDAGFQGHQRRRRHGRVAGTEHAVCRVNEGANDEH